MTCVAIDIDARIVVYGGFSPAELHRLTPQTDILTPRQEPVSVPDNVLAHLSPSMMRAPFEALHCFWNPLSSSSSSLLPSSLTMSDAEVLLSGTTSCMWVSWNSPKSSRNMPEDMTSDQALWFRFVSTFPHRKYTVNRSPKQMSILLSAMRLSFLHLLAPSSQGDPSIHVARCLLEFIRAHAKVLSAYLPLLYFLYEMDEKSVINFFTSLEELVRRRQSHECSLFNALMPRESSWFGWGGRKTAPKVTSLSEDAVFMESHAARLPSSLKLCFFISHSRKEALEMAQVASLNLRDALLEEVDAFAAVAEFCECSKHGLFNCEWKGFSADTKQQIWQTTKSAEAHAVKRALAEFMRVSNIMQEQIFGPILGTLTDTVKTAEVTVVAQSEYLRSVLECAKKVVQNEPFFVSEKCVPKSSQAAQRPGLLLQVTEHYQKVVLMFETCKMHLEEEISLSEKSTRKLLLSCCVQCFHAFTTFYDVFDARHHIKLIPPGDRREASLHPLMQLFRSTEKEGDAAQDFSGCT